MEDNTSHVFFTKLCKKYLPLPVRHFLNYFRNTFNFYVFKMKKQGFLNTGKKVESNDRADDRLIESVPRQHVFFTTEKKYKAKS
jgi:hypothetical protein